jgi:hypothetical protein
MPRRPFIDMNFGHSSQRLDVPDDKRHETADAAAGAVPIVSYSF